MVNVLKSEYSIGILILLAFAGLKLSLLYIIFGFIFFLYIMISIMF